MDIGTFLFIVFMKSFEVACDEVKLELNEPSNFYPKNIIQEKGTLNPFEYKEGSDTKINRDLLTNTSIGLEEKDFKIHNDPAPSNTGIDNRCSICGVAFRYVKYYIQYCKEEHGNHRPFKCQYCGLDFEYKVVLTKHYKHVHGKDFTSKRNTPFFCDICEKDIIGLLAFDVYVREAHRGVKFMRCEKCHIKYSSRRILMDHVKKEHADSEFKCKHCRNLFDRTDVLKRHKTLREQRQRKKRKGNIVCKNIELNLENVRFRCEKCPGEFESIVILKTHYKNQHPEVKLYSCDYRGESFSAKRYLDRHFDMQHTDKLADLTTWNKHGKRKMYTCPRCKKDFIGINKYENQHPGLELFYCVNCDKGFAHRSTMWYHQKERHRKEKWNCSRCGKSYSKRGNSRRHELICKRMAEKNENEQNISG